jgi:hypothetical protein
MSLDGHHIQLDEAERIRNDGVGGSSPFSGTILFTPSDTRTKTADGALPALGLPPPWTPGRRPRSTPRTAHRRSTGLVPTPELADSLVFDVDASTPALEIDVKAADVVGGSASPTLDPPICDIVHGVACESDHNRPMVCDGIVLTA